MQKEDQEDQTPMAGKQNPSPPSTGISRRDFARRVGCAAAAALPASLLPSAPAAAAFLPEPRESEMSGLPPESQTRVEEKLQSILRLYPDRFRADQVKELRRILIVIEKMLVKVRALPLENGDPPADVLKLYRGRDLSLHIPPSSQRGLKKRPRTARPAGRGR